MDVSILDITVSFPHAMVLSSLWRLFRKPLQASRTLSMFETDISGSVEVAVESLLQQSPEPSKSAAPTTPTNTRTRTTSLKRKKPEPEPTAEESDEEEAAEGDNALPYNTRHKGQKRVRVTAPPLPKMSSVRRRSTASRTAKKDVEQDESEDAPGETSVTPVKRGRGRPRKSTTTTAPIKADAASSSAVKRGRGRPRKSAASPPKKAGKQVFDGIELKRAKTRETTGDVDADGEPDDEAPAVPNGETSSLGSSNKGEHLL